jgi:biopolymer transport protein ExbD
MAGVSVEGRGKRRSVDTEVNMVPMIDLMMVTVSFLLLTAVWTHSARLDSTTKVPGGSDPSPPRESARLHVDIPQGEAPFRLTVRRGQSVVDQAELQRSERDTLGDKLQAMQKSHPADFTGDDGRTVVVHTENDLRYGDMIAVMDAIESPKDPRDARLPEFHVSLATK